MSLRSGAFTFNKVLQSVPLEAEGSSRRHSLKQIHTLLNPTSAGQAIWMFDTFGMTECVTVRYERTIYFG